jgi:transglutaminase-like putative cysteine protease
MSTAIPLRLAPPEIERLFQTSLFLLVVTGFATLAGTGKLDLPSVAFVLCALLLRAYLLLRDVSFVIPRRVTSWLAVVYVLLFFVDFFFISGRDFVTPAVHLVLFGMCVKLFNVERERDYVYLAVLSFLMVLSAAILTVDSMFLAAFALFIVLAVFCFMAMEMRRSALSATNTAPLAIPGLRTRRRAISPMQRLSLSLARTTGVMVMAILASACVLFFAMPRISGGYMSRYAQSDAITTGFSDSVNLGEIGHIQQSSEVVAHLRIEGDTIGDRSIRLRGAVLTLFDGKRWTNPRHEASVLAQGFGRVFQLSTRPNALDRREEVRVARGPHLDTLRYRVLMEPLNTTVIFTIPAAQAIFGSFREIGIDDDQTFHNLDRERNVSVYEGVSDVSVPLPTTLGRLTGTVPEAMPARYLEVPEHLDPRIPELAHQLTDAEPSTYRRAMAIERYLTTQFGYTLQLPSQPPDDPLADFLFHRRRGHCEYFASSMAVLLRTIGIPSRVITGFRGAEFNQVNSTYIVRASNAHSWVEAYIPGAGWTTFDPTPAGDAPVVTAWTRLQLYMDAAREFWREWVVNYDAAHQQALSINGARKTRNRIADFRRWSARQYNRMLEAARNVQREATHDPERLFRPGAGLLGVLLLIALPFVALHIRNLLRASSVSASPKSASAILYMRMVRRLARRGYPRTAAQTPAEFAASISDAEVREAVVRFTAAYEHARFGASTAAAANLPALLDQVRQTLARS